MFHSIGLCIELKSKNYANLIQSFTSSKTSWRHKIVA